MNILMVCYGNICRSPIAEGIMKSKFEKHQIDGFVDSAGVIGYHAGEAPDKRAIHVSGLYHIDISKQIARQFQKEDFKNFDYIFTLDKMVQEEIVSLAKTPDETGKVKLLMEFAGILDTPEVPDPYYGEIEGFETAFKMIDEACDKIVKTLQFPK